MLAASGPLEAAMGAMRVLLVHENADCRRICRTILEHDGVDVVETPDAEEALALITTRPFDLVATDLYVGSTSDECVVSRIKRSPTTADLPVIVMTSWTTEGHRRVAERGARG
jgi:CheY-like chemotaxis protein